MPLTLADFTEFVLDAYDAGTLITPKHDSSNIDTTYGTRRSIVTLDVKALVEGGDYRVELYEDSAPNHSKDLYVIVPNNPTPVAGSGIPPFSNTPDSSHDCLPVPSGHIQGWHVYAEDHSRIQSMSTLMYICDLA